MKNVILPTDEKIRFLCNVIYETSGISVFHYDADMQTIFALSKWENQIRNFFLLNCPYDLSALINSEDSTPLYYSDSLHLNWFLLPLIGQHSFFVLGPVFETDVTPAFFQKKMEFQTMSVSSQIHFLKMLHDIPVFPYTQFFGYLSMIYYGIYHTQPALVTTPSNYPPTEKHSASFDIMEKAVGNVPKSHGSRLQESLMLEGVRTGNIHLLQDMQNTVSSASIVGTLAINDPLRQAKNAIIAQITLVTRSAVEGGMHMDTAYSLSDFYIQQLELCKTRDEVYQLSTKMYETFVAQVHEIRTKHYPPLVLSMCSYIDQHLFTVISLETMAEELGYDTYYLTTVFRKNTGKTIKCYILEKKVEQAKILLSTTQMEIQEISDDLSFKSSSYFCTQFKKITGESPLSYRKRSGSPV